MASYSFSPSTSTALDTGVSTTFTVTGTAGSYERFIGDATYPNIEVIVNGSVVERATGSMFSARTVSITCNVPSAASFTVKAYFKLYDGDDYFTNEPSATYNVNAGKCGPPSTVSVEKTDVAPGTSVKLSWGDGTSGGGGNTLYGYNVYWSTSADGPYTMILSGVASPQYVTSSWTNNSSYYYKITAYGTRGGESEMSSAYATLTTTYSSPSAPKNLTISATQVRRGSTITVGWEVPDSAGLNNSIYGYRIYYMDAYDDSYHHYGDVSASVQRVDLWPSQTTGMTRYFCVTALGTISGTESGASNAVSVTTKGGTIKYHNGTGWIECEVYYHNGSQWIECEPRYHDGTSWKEVSS